MKLCLSVHPWLGQSPHLPCFHKRSSCFGSGFVLTQLALPPRPKRSNPRRVMSKGYQSGFFSSFLRGSDFYKSLGLIPITVSRLTKVKIKKPASVAVPSLPPNAFYFSISWVFIQMNSWHLIAHPNRPTEEMLALSILLSRTSISTDFVYVPSARPVTGLVFSALTL